MTEHEQDLKRNLRESLEGNRFFHFLVIWALITGVIATAALFLVAVVGVIEAIIFSMGGYAFLPLLFLALTALASLWVVYAREKEEEEHED